MSRSTSTQVYTVQWSYWGPVVQLGYPLVVDKETARRSTYDTTYYSTGTIIQYVVKADVAFLVQ